MHVNQLKVPNYMYMYMYIHVLTNTRLHMLETSLSEIT